MDIWTLRTARGLDRPVVVGYMEKADLLLKEFNAMVKTWEESGEEDEKVWTPEEWSVAQQIKERVLAPGKRIWVNNPPWNEA